MTKEVEKTEEKKLVWKMKELPTADSIGKLVDTKVITAKEARAILFKEDSKESTEVEALKEMVDALQEMVTDLLNRPQGVQIVPYTKIVEVPTRIAPYWDRHWSNGSTGGLTVNATTGDRINTVYTLSVK